MPDTFWVLTGEISGSDGLKSVDVMRYQFAAFMPDCVAALRALGERDTLALQQPATWTVSH